MTQIILTLSILSKFKLQTTRQTQHLGTIKGQTKIKILIEENWIQNETAKAVPRRQRA